MLGYHANGNLRLQNLTLTPIFPILRETMEASVKAYFRPVDLFGIVGVIGVTIGAIGLQDCILAWFAGLSLHSVYTTIASRSGSRR